MTLRIVSTAVTKGFNPSSDYSILSLSELSALYMKMKQLFTSQYRIDDEKATTRLSLILRNLANQSVIRFKLSTLAGYRT